MAGPFLLTIASGSLDPPLDLATRQDPDGTTFGLWPAFLWSDRSVLLC
jgi:hypothetical protein